jgi:hypothetical protein
MEKESPGNYFELWRQDDYGNKFFIKKFSSLKEALEEKNKFEERGHKDFFIKTN